MIFVDAGNLKVPYRRPLFPEAELLRHPSTGTVTRHDGRLDAMESERLESVLQDERDSLGDVAQSGPIPVDPIPDRRRLERAALHRAQAHLTDELLTVTLHDKVTADFELIDALGRCVLRQQRIASSFRAGLQDIAPGLYHVRLHFGNDGWQSLPLVVR